MTFCWQNWHDDIDKVTTASHSYRKLHGSAIGFLPLVSRGCGSIPHEAIEIQNSVSYYCFVTGVMSCYLFLPTNRFTCPKSKILNKSRLFFLDREVILSMSVLCSFVSFIVVLFFRFVQCPAFHIGSSSSRSSTKFWRLLSFRKLSIKRKKIMCNFFIAKCI